MPHKTLLGRRRWYAAATALVLTAGLAGPAIADDLKDRQRDVQRGIRGAKSELQESSQAAYQAQRRLERARTQLGAAQDRLAATRGQLTAARVLDARMQADLEAAQLQLARARDELRISRQQVRDQRDEIGRMAAATYEANDPQLMRLLVLFNTQDPAAATTQLETVDALADKQEGILDDLKALRERMADQEAKVEQTRDVVRVRRQEAAENLVERQRLEEQAAADRAAVAEMVSARGAAAAAAGRAKAADARQLASLRRENDRISSILAARAARARSQGNDSGGGGGSGNGLMRPVDGYVTSPFGYRIHPIYGYYGLHDGTDFHAPCGTPLRAVGNGVVVDAYYSSVWGNRVIVDLGRVRGQGVSVIYNHLTSDTVSRGERVGRGEVIGYSGTTGWSTACHLHFTLMSGGNPVDPMRWF